MSLCFAVRYFGLDRPYNLEYDIIRPFIDTNLLCANIKSTESLTEKGAHPLAILVNCGLQKRLVVATYRAFALSVITADKATNIDNKHCNGA